MDELEYITAKALFMCNQGAAPDFFNPTYNLNVKIHGCLASTKVDFVPFLNIPSFKICKITQKPCVPATIPWEDTWQVKVLGQETLIGMSKCKCTLGGTIEFMTSGQVPLPEDVQAEVDDMQKKAQKELDDAGYGDSVGETGFVEGMIPVWGSGRDMINDIQTGDVGGAILNAGFLIWDVGSIVAGVFSFGAGTAAMQGAKAGIKGVIKAGAKAISKDALRELGEVAFKKLSKEALKESMCNLVGKLTFEVVTACFPAGTPIQTEFGITKIEDIKAGDKVWSYNEKTGKTGLKTVLRTITSDAFVTLKLTIDNEIIETTPEHPFCTQVGWKYAANLNIMDIINRKDSSSGKITAIEYNYISKKVFNFVIADWHTYFVGMYGWLVHNSCSIFKSAQELARLLGTSVENFHRTIKKAIEKDAAEYMKKIGTTNPDIGVDALGKIVLKNPKTGKEIVTDLLLEWYK